MKKNISYFVLGVAAVKAFELAKKKGLVDKASRGIASGTEKMKKIKLSKELFLKRKDAFNKKKTDFPNASFDFSDKTYLKVDAVSKKMKLKPETLKDWSLVLEENGYIFERENDLLRDILYTEFDIHNLEVYRYLVEDQQMSRLDAARVLIDELRNDK